MEAQRVAVSADEGPSSVIERVLRILETFTLEDSSLSLAELTRRSDLPKPTVHRLASQLIELGMLERYGTRYRPSRRLFKLGATIPTERHLRNCALPFMEDLYEATHEVVHLGLRDGLSVLYLERISGHNSHAVGTLVGTTKPLYCTAIGKAILAHSPDSIVDRVIKSPPRLWTPYTIVQPDKLRETLAEIKRTGIAFDHQEFSTGVTCVAAPILDGAQQAIGALSIAGRSGRFHPERLALAVRTAALGVSRAVRAGRLSSG